jgi:SAM-dependent methyltransferase
MKLGRRDASVADRVAPEFDAYARDYERLLEDPLRTCFATGPVFFHERKLQVLLNLLAGQGLRPAAIRWLDVGCGKGDLLRIGAQHFASAAGCDPSPEMIRASGLDGLQVQNSAGQLPFESESFDLVTAACVYHHVPSDGRPALGDEICRVLRPGGTFCLFEHNPWNPVTRLIVSRTPLDREAVLLSRRESEETVKRSGFRAVTGRFFLYLPEPLYRVIPSLENWLGRVPAGGQYAILFQRP